MRTLLAITILVGLSSRATAENTDTTPQPTEDDKTEIAVKKALEEDRKARLVQEDADRKAKQERDVAEDAYKKEAIVFRDFMVATVGNNGITSVGSGTVAYRNGRKLSTDEFYDAVERPDLAATYRRRITIGRALSWGGLGVALGSSGWLLYKVSNSDRRCEVGAPDFSACLDREGADRNRALIQSTVVAGAGLVMTVVGLVVTVKAQTTSMNENHDMADAHNAKLRKKHRLPTARVTPYGSPDGAGLAMVGRF